MLKLLAAGCVILGTSGIGFSMLQEQKSRLYQLKYLEYIMVLIQNEIRYQAASLPEICQSIEKRLESPYREFFACINQEFLQKDGREFPSIWQEAGRRLKGREVIPKAEWEQFLQFPSKKGYANGDMQIREMEGKIKAMQTSIRRMEEKLERDEKLYLCAGVMSGVLGIILFW